MCVQLCIVYPIWVLFGRAHMGLSIWDTYGRSHIHTTCAYIRLLYGAYKGPQLACTSIWACPYHMCPYGIVIWVPSMSYMGVPICACPYRTHMGHIWACPYGRARIQPTQDPYGLAIWVNSSIILITCTCRSIFVAK